MHWLCNGQRQHVQAIAGMIHLGKEFPLLIPYSQCPIFNEHPTPNLIELPNTHNAALQSWNVVDVHESLMVTMFCDEHKPLMSTTDASPKRTVPMMDVSMSANEFTLPVIWLDTLESRYQATSHGAMLSRFTVAFSSLRKTWSEVITGRRWALSGTGAVLAHRRRHRPMPSWPAPTSSCNSRAPSALSFHSISTCCCTPPHQCGWHRSLSLGPAWP
jgi:hypothetical protein